MMGAVNFCDMSPAERVSVLASINRAQQARKELLTSVYGDRICINDGGTCWHRRPTGFGIEWRFAPELDQAAASWLAGHRKYWVRCGGAEMLCEMDRFPLFRVVKYLNADTYGRRGIGETIRPEETNEFSHEAQSANPGKE